MDRPPTRDVQTAQVSFGKDSGVGASNGRSTASSCHWRPSVRTTAFAAKPKSRSQSRASEKGQTLPVDLLDEGQPTASSGPINSHTEAATSPEQISAHAPIPASSVKWLARFGGDA